MHFIHIRGARTHNLQNVDVTLPRDRLIVITGVSGSGKSSLAFDTLYAEGQRRYVESLSAYARQFLSVMQKPDVDHIQGLSPAIAIEQKAAVHNPRSTVATITEVHDYLRLLYARAGEPRCPVHDVVLEAQTVSEMVDRVLEEPEGTRMMLLAPLVEGRKGEHRDLLESLRGQGFVRARVDGEVVELEAVPALERARPHTLEAVVDRFRVRPGLAQRLAESFETALRLADGCARVARLDAGGAEGAGGELLFSARFACPHCGYSLPALEPQLFSFNNPHGACPGCKGLGTQQFFDPARVVARPELSLAEGAVRGWDRRNTDYFQLVQALAAHYGFDPETPFEALPARARDAILYGSGEEAIRLGGDGAAGGGRTAPFEGIIPNMERRYRESDTAATREELARYLGVRACPECGGTRLNRHARQVFVAGRALPEVEALSVARARDFFAGLRLPGRRGPIAARIVEEIEQRLAFLVDVGLDYLSLDRGAATLSGGEGQRIRLASQIGAGLMGVMYVLDEPSIGLHPRDHRRLLDSLLRLRDLGNTVIVVEHDADAIRSADHVVDMGPGAGAHGGRVVAHGPPEAIADEPASLTGQYLCGRRQVQVSGERRRADPKRRLRLTGACGNNLRSVELCVPLGLMTCVTGVSGSGKSTLVNDTLYRALAGALGEGGGDPAPYQTLEGADGLDKVVAVDQSPIGRTPRSNPATYTGLFAPVRGLFAATPEARARGYGAGRFSFNARGGRCEACQGDGVIRVEMHFLPDMYVNCDVCGGRRYNRETLEVRYRGANIHEVLEMTVEEARRFFGAVPVLARKLQTLMDVGLGYVKLGQSATTLSGGEAQRVKLARELSRREAGRTLYILDEPTTGLHFQDIEQLLRVLIQLRDRGNTVLVIEHNLDVIKTADWVVDLGPESGEAGGRVVAAGTPEQIAAEPGSHTGRYLASVLEAERRRKVG